MSPSTRHSCLHSQIIRSNHFAHPSQRFGFVSAIPMAVPVCCKLNYKCSIALDPCTLVYYTGHSSFYALSFPLSWCCIVMFGFLFAPLVWLLWLLEPLLPAHWFACSMPPTVSLMNVSVYSPGECTHWWNTAPSWITFCLGEKKLPYSSIAIFLLFWSAGSGHRNSLCFTPITYTRKGTCTSPDSVQAP